jgi:hypothetical protein
MKILLIFFALLLLCVSVNAVYVPPPDTFMWMGTPMDLINATPLNPGEYYFVDYYLYINYGMLKCNLLYMDFAGNCYAVNTPLSNYFMKRIPPVGGKYRNVGGDNTMIGGGIPDFVEITT